MQITVRAKVRFNESQQTLNCLMRIYQSALRFTYNRLIENTLSDNALKKLIQNTFGLNARYSYSALVEAKEIISSQKKLLPIYLDAVITKIKKSKKKLKKVQNEPVKTMRIENRIKKLELKKQNYENYITTKTIPKIVFGGMRNFERLKQGKLSKRKWRAIRTNTIYSIGGKIDGGNQNLRLIHIEGNTFRLRINIGTRKWIYGIVEVKSPYLAFLINQVRNRNPYSVRIIRKGTNYKVHISFNIDFNTEINRKEVAGIDLNPKGIGVSLLYPNGNFRKSKWFQCPELVSVKKNKRDWIIGNLIKELIEWLKSFNTNTIVLEELKFKNTLDTNRKLNRIRSNFTYKRMKENIVTKCLRENIALIFVNPAYTSIIGRLKYQKRFGVNDHQAAAYVIARKGMGFKEKLPRTLRSFVSSSEKNSLGFWKKLWSITKLMERRGYRERFQDRKERVPNREPPLSHSGRRANEREGELRENRSSTGEIVKSGVG